MKPDMIDRYRAVQKYRGTWKIGDRLWCYDCKTEHIVNNMIRFCPAKIDEDTTYRYLWLPPVWSEDERCLWAMVDWERWHLSTLVKPHRVAMFPPSGRPIFTNSLPEALLRAIKEQEAENANG